MKSGSIIALPGIPESFSLEVSDGQTIYIGRKAKTSGGHEENRLILAFPEVSAKHAEIRCYNNQWTIVDSGSTNGTTINGVRLNPGKEYTLKDQDVVGIANYNLLISLTNAQLNTEPLQTEGLDIEVEQDRTQFQVKLITATILVADLKRFTSLMEEFAYDPAVVMQAASRVFEKLAHEIENKKGQIEKIAGDAMMAYWWSQESPVDISTSSYLACLAALHLQAITKQLGNDKSIWPFPEHPLVFDMALATGPVAKGALGKSQGNPALLGDTANLVFRLEKLIPDNELEQIIIDQNTYNLVKEHFTFKFLGEYAIKGRHNFANVYQLLGTLN